MAEGEDTDGVFGIAAGNALKRLPSAAYWGGLGSWGIRLAPGHQDAYFRSLDSFYRQVDRHKAAPADPEGRTAAPANWHPHVPEPPKGFPYEASVALRRRDAEYLCDRIQARHSGTLLAELVRRPEASSLEAPHAHQLDAILDLPSEVRHQLHHGALFALVFHGAALLYNFMLSEALGDAGEEKVEGFGADLASWAAEVAEVSSEIAEWELPGLWKLVRDAQRSIGFPTRAFVERWVTLVREKGPERVLGDDGARRLIADRELRLKRGRARLHHRRHLELWGGSSGAGRMDFRWTNTKRLLRDIFAGLTRENDDAADA